MAENTIRNIFTITGLLVYLTLSGGLWQFAYWNRFNINIFEYLSLYDIPKNFIMPVLSSLGMALLFYIINSFILNYDRLDSERSVFWGKGEKTPFGQILHKLLPFMIIIYSTTIYMFILYNNRIIWHLLPFLLSAPMAVYLVNRNFLKDFLLNPEMRFALFYVALSIPVASYCQGKIAADKLLSKEVSHLVTEICTKDKPLTELIGHNYIGTAGGVIFLADSSYKRTTLVNQSDIVYYTTSR